MVAKSTDILVAIEDQTNAINDLSARLAAQGLPQDQIDLMLAGVTANTDKIKALAATPATDPPPTA